MPINCDRCGERIPQRGHEEGRSIEELCDTCAEDGYELRDDCEYDCEDWDFIYISEEERKELRKRINSVKAINGEVTSSPH